MDTARDLACAELWQASLERSLARRGRSTRGSLELFHLRPERDLSRLDVLRESATYSQLRRSAVATRPSMALPGAGGISALALLAAAALPGLLGGKGGAAHAAPMTYRADEHATKLAKAPAIGTNAAPRHVAATTAALPGTTTTTAIARAATCPLMSRYRGRSRPPGRSVTASLDARAHRGRPRRHRWRGSPGVSCGERRRPRRRRSTACRRPRPRPRSTRIRTPAAVHTLRPRRATPTRPRPRHHAPQPRPCTRTRRRRPCPARASTRSRSSTTRRRSHRAGEADPPQHGGGAIEQQTTVAHPRPVAVAHPAPRRRAPPGGVHPAARKAGTGTRATGGRRPVREPASPTPR